MFSLKKTMFIGSLGYLAGNLLAAQATKIWQLYLTHGLLVGMVFALIYAPVAPIIPRWFLKKRGLAFGCALSGTGLGGLVYSFATNAVINRTGDQRWAIRMVGISTFATVSLAIILIRENPPNYKVTKRPKRSWQLAENDLKFMFDKRILYDRKFYHILLWYIFSFFGYNLLVYSFASYATAVGYSQTQGSALGAILNATQVIGRPLIGLVADRFVGRVNYCVALCVVSTVFILTYWIKSDSYGQLVGLAVCFGFFIGVGNVMNSVLVADAFSPSLFQAGFSFLNIFNSLPILVVEVSVLKLRDDSLSNPYINCQIFAGMVYLAAALSLLPLRECIIKEQFQEEKRFCLENLESTNFSEKDDLLFRIQKCDKLLEKSFIGYLKRLLYPRKI
jgi:MFS family permease